MNAQIARIFSTYSTILAYRELIHFSVAQKTRAGLFKTVLGRGWLLLEPLSLIGVYYFLFFVVFQIDNTTGVHPLLILVQGITHYLFFRSAVMNVTNAVVSNESLLKQIAIAPAVFMAAAMADSIHKFFMPFLLYVGLYAVLGNGFHGEMFAYPIFLLALALMAWGLGLAAGTLQVFFRDTAKFLSVFLRLLMYALPVLYAIDRIPEAYADWYLLNPLAVVFAGFQAVVLHIGTVGAGQTVYAMVCAIVVVLFGHVIYNLAAHKMTKAL